MIRRATPAVLAAFLLLAPSVSRADLANYSQDFESLVQSNPAALNADGWLVFGNVFSPDHSAYYYGYGPFPAPNGGAAFCGIDLGQGGPGQGAQQLVVYNDYNSGEHPSGNLVEANVFQQQTIGAADVGSTWIFRFDAKRGNIEAPTEAVAFIKTLDPNNGFATTNFIQTSMTNVPATWGAYFITINITPALAGQILQFGFNSTTTGYAGSGIFYDNVSFQKDVPVSVKPATWGSLKKLYR